MALGCVLYGPLIAMTGHIWQITEHYFKASPRLLFFCFSDHLRYCRRRGMQCSRELLRWRDALQFDEAGKWLAMTENGTWWLWETGVRLHVIRCKLKPDCKRLLRLGKARARENWNEQYSSPWLTFFFFFLLLLNSLGSPTTVIKSVIQSANWIETDPAPDGISTKHK